MMVTKETFLFLHMNSCGWSN